MIADLTLTEEQRREGVLAVVRSHFKPEFLNRLDDIVVFHALRGDDLRVDRGHPARPAARAGWPTAGWPWTSPTPPGHWLAEHGYDPIYGARPLRRLVQSAIGDQLAKALLGGAIRDGDTVQVDLNPGANTLTVTPA